MNGKLVCVCYDDVFEKKVFDEAAKLMKHRGKLTEIFVTEKQAKIDSIILSRDRLGVHPLYWMDTKHGFIAASEMKAFLPFIKSYRLPWTLNEEALYEYMMFRYVAGGATLIKEVYRALPEEVFKIKERNITSKVESSLFQLMLENKETSIDETEGLLTKAVEDEFDPDECGVILSGGVDSSLLTALSSGLYDGSINYEERINTISMVFDDFENSELKWSRNVAYTYNTNHTEIHFNSKDFGDNYLKAIWHNDEPINFPNSIAIMFMSQYIKEKMGFSKVMAGEGADEIFAGYGFFVDSEVDFKRRTQYVLARDIKDLMKTPYEGSSFRDTFKTDTLNDQMWYTFHTYLQTVCNRLDKMTKAYGVEAVCPFVDEEVVNASMRLPDEMKVRNGITKWVIKKIAEKYIDHEQIYRPKIGFSVPINYWLRDEGGLGEFVGILEEERTLNRNIYKADGIKELLHNFKNNPELDKFTYAGRVWTLLNLELWIRTFIEEKQQLE